MTRPIPTLVAALLSFSAATPAFAQAATPDEGIAVGAWTFRPSLEVRIRGEYMRHPVDTGGDVFGSTAVLADGVGSNLPTIVDTQAQVKDQYLVAERSRVGLAVDRGPVTAAVTLQDARVFGTTETAFAGPGEPALPSFAPLEAYLDLHTRSGRRVFFRVGRQRVQWGDGWLVGEDEWSPTARALDAARFGMQLGDLDVETMAALLAAPGGLPPSASGTQESAPPATGSQLYGLDAVYHLWPLLQAEVTGLARIVREPVPTSLTPGDTFVIDGRLFGDRRGFRYAAEGAVELGRVGLEAGQRDLAAFAFNAHASLETRLLWHLTFGVEGAYASGDDGTTKGNLTRFDPILPNEHDILGPMSLFAWSNVAEVGGTIGAKPMDGLDVLLGYRYVALADAQGRWTTAALDPVGAAPTNTSSSLGHELDASFRVAPWQPIAFETGYGLFVDGDGARAILRDVGRPATLQHWVYLQAQVRAP
ncbi:MAG TPA: alginate export family protein [Minicystis sp.]|nr:alginate export family protein [Minicystis sp.]